MTLATSHTFHPTIFLRFTNSLPRMANEVMATCALSNIDTIRPIIKQYA